MKHSIVKGLILWGLCAAVQAACPHEGIEKLWSKMDLTGDVEITEPIVLDIETEDLNTVVISGNGSLIFSSDVPLAKLTSSRITIDDGGSLVIGSDDCRFSGKAEIELTGDKLTDEGEDDEDFGHKFLGVKAGGSLEIYGEDKLSWTRLTKTLNPNPRIFSTEAVGQPALGGIAIYEFDRATGENINIFDRVFWKRDLEHAIDSLADDSVVILMSRGARDRKGKSHWIFDDLDKSASLLGCFVSPAAEILKEEWQDVDDAWVLMIDRSTSEHSFAIDHVDADKPDAYTGDVYLSANNILYRASTKSSTKERGSDEALVLTAEGSDHHEFTIEIDDEPKGWQAGDVLVIASTDYDMDQAEEVTIKSIDGKTVTVDGDIKYMHFGEVYEGVDMRAEVGLLTRNIKIYGRMGDKCISEGKECDSIDFDIFGGHMKAIKGFKFIHIEGAEITRMGQMNTLGSYPVHFHMCEETNGPIVKSNSIHHCFSRCVTIHGSHGITVENNVGYDTYGHCYFLEDGGERRTQFLRNLGLVTRKGFLTPSDDRPTTFWLTSPDSITIGNAAAGADSRTGVGFWYLFANSPVGPSKGLGFFKKGEAKHTVVTAFENNTAHSNGDVGLGFFRRLGDGHTILGCSTYNPREEPLNRRSELTPVILKSFTGYKNRRANVHMRATTSQMIDFKLAESQVGVFFVRNMINGYQLMKDSIILGETPNSGKGHRILITDSNGKRRWVDSDRSYPNRRNAENDQVGVFIDSEGPLHLTNLDIKIKTNDIRRACAIKFKDKFNLGMGPSSSVAGLRFDENLGNTICHDNKVMGTDESSMILRDKDGSLTGAAGNAVVATDPFRQGDMNCTTNSEWNMSVCKGSFARIIVFPKSEQVATFLTRDDERSASNFGSARFTAYTINSNDKFTLHWNGTIKKDFTVYAAGLEKGQSLRLGLCIPMGAVNEPLASFLTMRSGVVEATSLEDLDSNPDNTAFMDKTNGVLYVKFTMDMERGPDDLADCPGSLIVKNACPTARLKLKNLDVDLQDGDCTNRA